MAHVRIRKGWGISESNATPESIYYSRRGFLRSLGLASIGAVAFAGGACRSTGDAGAGAAQTQDAADISSGAKSELAYEPQAEQVRAGLVEWSEEYLGRHPGARNPEFTLDRDLTRESIAASYNNFYEFTEVKDRVWRTVHSFEARPWTVEVRGLVERPLTLDIEKLVQTLSVEERLYRHRCVEAWAMAVPWSGIPMKKFVEYVKPLGSANFVRMVSFHRPEQAPGFENAPHYPWPYVEGLTMAEATNELTLLATGIYGHPLPKQHGAPLRLVTPWKYGFKSIKSIVLFEFVEEQPKNFWNVVIPREYGFFANVDPKVPHPRWSQASERLIGTNLKVPTLPFNGYGEFVADLYG
jgi:sulfoxide reductase catalytic subunit YedY